MVENYFVMERRRIKNDLLTFIKNNRDLGLDKCLAQFSMKTGFRVSTLRVYLEELKEAELIG